MNLEELCKLFSNDELKDILKPEIKEYVHRTKKKYIIKYLIKNFKNLLDDNNFLFILKKVLIRNHLIDLLNLVDDINKNKLNILSYLNLITNNNKVEDEREIDVVVDKRFYELLDYQYLIKEKAINFILRQIHNNIHLNRLVIHMPTGTGKTKTAVHLITSLYETFDNKGIVVWLAHTEELINQGKEAFKHVWQVLGNKKINVFFDVKEIENDNSIYFLSYQKLIYLKKKNESSFEKIRDLITLCVCDEAHKCLASETKTMLEALMVSFNQNHPKTLIGLTATPGRRYKDSLLAGDNLNLALMFDKNIFQINVGELEIFKINHLNNISNREFSYDNIFAKDTETIKYFQEKKVLAKIKRVALTYDLDKALELNKIFTRKHNSDYSKDELFKIGINKERNKAIINKLIELDRHNVPTILFACSNEQGGLLSDILTLTGINNNVIFGDTLESQRKQAITDFEQGKYNILINNSILTTGFDSPRIKCVFITRPTNSIVLYSQMLGRGLRGVKMGGNEECLLIDVIDNLNKFNDENFAFNYFDIYWR